ncbi:MAG: cell division protein FtsL [Deferrisomatales bacterium]|nr:cell division protein FtsL [Deferrisomatales bacterium]
MSVTKPARALALPAPPWSLPALGRWGVRAGVFALCLFSALLLTAARLEITRLHYDLSDLYRQKEAVGAEVSRLEVEAATLSSSRRIEELAKTQGFVYPDRNSVIVLDE